MLVFDPKLGKYSRLTTRSYTGDDKRVKEPFLRYLANNYRK